MDGEFRATSNPGAVASESDLRLACLRQAAPLLRGLTLTSPISGALMLVLSRAPVVPSAIWFVALVLPSLVVGLTAPGATAAAPVLRRWEPVLSTYLLLNQVTWVSALAVLHPPQDRPEVQTAQLLILVAVANSLVLLGAFIPRIFGWSMAVLGGGVTVLLLFLGIGFNRFLALAVPVYVVILVQLQTHMRAATERSVRLALENEVLVRELGVEQERLAHEANHDHLTGLLNRPAFLRAVDRRLAAVTPFRAVAVAFVDLDHFKEVNDAYGHGVGDRVLSVVAERLRAVVRGEDVVGRFGGDEFVVLLGPVDDLSGARAAGARITGAFEEPVVVDGLRVATGVSVGVGLGHPGRCDAEGLIELADQAVYAAKAAGRRRVEVVELAAG